MAGKSRIGMLWWCLHLGYVQIETGMDGILHVSWPGWGDWTRGIAMAFDTLTLEIFALILDKSFLFPACN